MNPLTKPLILTGIALASLVSPAFADVLTATAEGNGTINYDNGVATPVQTSDIIRSGNELDNEGNPEPLYVGILKFELPTLPTGQTFSDATFSFYLYGLYQNPSPGTNDVSVAVYTPSNSDDVTTITSADATESGTAVTVAPDLITPTSPGGTYSVSNTSLDAAITAAYAAGDTSIALALDTPAQLENTEVYEFASDASGQTNPPSLTIDTVAAAPEPAPVMLVLCGLAVLGFVFRSRSLGRSII